MKLKKKCGIFGLFSIKYDNTLIDKTIIGLEHLQHRGREAAGISYYNDNIVVYKNFGLVKSIFKDFKNNNILVKSCIGHTRYSTTKKSNKSLSEQFDNIQPLYSELYDFSLVHNGNIPNMDNIIKKYNITDMKTDSDSEIFVKLIQMSKKKTFDEKVIEIVDKIPGVYSLIIQTKEAIYGIKDRYGIRPLCLAHNGETFCLSSESTYTGECSYIRELLSSEVVKIDNNGVNTIYKNDTNISNFCLFERIYFMKHTSTMNNELIESQRYTFGYKLGESEDILEYNNKHIIVVDIPNTAIPSAKGYADALNLKYTPIFEKISGTGRTFILPNNNSRYTTNRKGLKFKDNVTLDTTQSIVLVDDSLVRGNTIKSIVQKLHEYGITDIHLRISSPPVKYPCYYGIDIPTKEELLAYNHTIPEIENLLGITSLRYLDYDEMAKLYEGTHCGSCFTGKYNNELMNW
tara:strand:+ start:3068 stop:4447 length:1380 start_codon:yes stop_codon:yes gene_type:complete